jgi:predicted lactoylglutathione lyase
VTSPRKLFVNLAVHDLKKTQECFAALGFSYNPQFTMDGHWEVVWMDPTAIQ